MGMVRRPVTIQNRLGLYPEKWMMRFVMEGMLEGK